MTACSSKGTEGKTGAAACEQTGPNDPRLQTTL